MFRFTFLWFAAAFLTAELVNSEVSCVSFAANISTVPHQKGYNATLNFTIINQCAGRDMWVKTVKVVTETEKSVAVPSCQITFLNKTELLFASGCTYDPVTHTWTVKKHISAHQDENWNLLGALENGNTFNTRVHIRPNCASFTTNTSTVPYRDFYNAILTFTISNQCTGKASWVKRVTVSTEKDLSEPSCQIAFFNSTTLPVAKGCTYDPKTSTGIFSKNINGSEGEVWTLVGVLEHGHTFTTSVNITLSGSRVSTSEFLVLIIAASVGTIIILSIIIVVCGVRKIRRATQDASESTGDSYYLHAISPPAEQRRSQPAKTSVQTQTLRRHADEDEYGYTMPDGLQSIANRQVVTKSPCQDTGASTSMSNTDVRGYRLDDDGYVLADSADTKEDDERQYENSARDRVRPHKSHSKKFDDDGYMLHGTTEPLEGHFGTSEAEYQN